MEKSLPSSSGAWSSENSSSLAPEKSLLPLPLSESEPPPTNQASQPPHVTKALWSLLTCFMTAAHCKFIALLYQGISRSAKWLRIMSKLDFGMVVIRMGGSS